MPFAVFRRYQKTLMAALALFAMIAFTLDFSLLRFGGGVGDPYLTVSATNDEPITLYGKRLRQSDLNAMMAQRARANRFMMLIGAPTQYFFGGLDTASIVDALILQHKADELGLPTSKELAIRWLQQSTNNQLTSAVFDQTYRQHFASEVTDVQLLQDIANQIRLAQVRNLPGAPLVTPLDVYQAYRDQNERISARLVPFRVEEFLDEAPQPTDAEVRDYFEKYKDIEPDPARDTPGFKVPTKIVVEFVMADVPRLAEEIEPRLTEAKLRDYFRDHRDEFFVSEPELPVAVFAGAPELTPSLRDEFVEVRDQVARRLARQQAEDQVRTKFEAVEARIASFNDEYFQAKDAAEQQGRTDAALPTPGDLMKQAAEEQGLEFEKTPPIDRRTAESYGRIGTATAGGGPFDPGVRFAEEFFSPSRQLYETVVMSDSQGRQYLAWKIDEQPARVPQLAEVRDEVVRAWRMEKARDLAARAARTFAQKVREANHDIEQVARAESKEVVTTVPVPRMMAGLPDPLNPYQPAPARPSEIPQVPDAGPEFRDAYFRLGPNSVFVEPNASKTVYYVMTLNEAFPVSIAGLYDPYQGQRVSIQAEVFADALTQRSREWMEELRAEAGLDPNWVPPEQREPASRTS